MRASIDNFIVVCETVEYAVSLFEKTKKLLDIAPQFTFDDKNKRMYYKPFFPNEKNMVVYIFVSYRQVIRKHQFIQNINLPKNTDFILREDFEISLQFLKGFISEDTDDSRPDEV